MAAPVRPAPGGGGLRKLYGRCHQGVVVAVMQAPRGCRASAMAGRNRRRAALLFAIENVDLVDLANGIIVVGNDNNLPFSSSRAPKKADDNALLLQVKALFTARAGSDQVESI